MGKFPERNDLCAADLRERGEGKIIEEKEEETPSERVKRELLGWPGVTVHDHRFGGIEFRVNGRGRWVICIATSLQCRHRYSVTGHISI
jgi:hypothetical protein